MNPKSVEELSLENGWTEFLQNNPRVPEPTEEEKFYWELSADPDIQSAIRSIYHELIGAGYEQRWGNAVRRVLWLLDDLHVQELKSRGEPE